MSDCRAWVFVLVGGIQVCLAGCGTSKPAADAPLALNGESAGAVGVFSTPFALAPIAFEEVAERLGVRFKQVSGNSTDKHFPAANGSGVAMVDLDNDGLLDLYFLTARPLPFLEGSPGPTNRLFRQLPGGGFEDVSQSARLDLALFSHGVVDGDLDNDGFVDLVLTSYGGTRMLRNNGDGTFAVALLFFDPRWGSSAAVLDYDEDGCLDVYVTHYGVWSAATNEFCGNEEKHIRTFCNPRRVAPAVHALFRNLGDGRFVEATKAAGIARGDGRGQGVVAADVDLDGHIDLYVANDLCPNFLFINNGRGGFSDQSDLSGTSFNREGVAQAGMGTDCGDYNRDGQPDLFVTNFAREYNALYKNLGGGLFIDNSHAAGVAVDSMDEVGWGTRLVDLDNDGWLDIFVTNGHVDDNVSLISAGRSYAQPTKVWRNHAGVFKLQRQSCGPYFEIPHVGRGAAFGDFDNDGRLDIAVNHVDAPPALLHNISPVDPDFPTPWIRLSLVGTRSNRDAVGTRVTLSGPGLPPNMVQQRTSGASYLSAHDSRLLIGIGKVKTVAKVEVRWPSGKIVVLENLAAGAERLLVEPRTP